MSANQVAEPAARGARMLWGGAWLLLFVGHVLLVFQFMPPTVLISPLWERNRNGCARRQAGKVLVEKREWNIAIALTTLSF